MADAIIEGTSARVAAGDRPPSTSCSPCAPSCPNWAWRPEAAELVDQMHRPENRVLHDRLADDLTTRLVPLLEEVIEQGVAEGDFAVDDTRAAAWFVLAGLQSVELAGTALDEMPAALAKATGFALRALGYQGPRP